MSVEETKVADQNSALLNFLSGGWTTKLSAYIHSLISPYLISRVTCLRGMMARGLFQRLPNGGLSGNYLPLESPTEDVEPTTDSFLRLELDRSGNSLVAYLGEDESVPGIKGIWSNSALRFRGNFYDGITMWQEFHEISTAWEEFHGIGPQVTARPSSVSLIIYQVSEIIWLLDVMFEVGQSYPSQATPARLRCRLEFWHFRQHPGASIPPHPQDIEDSFDEILQKCDETTQDLEFRIEEIDDLIESLENRKAKCEEQLQLLSEIKPQAESGKDEADTLDEDVQDAILELHESPFTSAEGAAVAGEPKDILSRARSESDSLQADAESLETEIDSIDDNVDFTVEDLIGSVWTNAEYARGQRLLREHRNQLPPPDLSFLGPLQPLVSKLSEEATKIVKTTALHVQMALRDEPPEWLEYGPPIASMAKSCERILADVFKEKKEAIERDPVVGAFVSDERSWQYRIPVSMSKVTTGDLTSVAKLVKKSIETNTAIKWNGMGNKRIALLLFGGWIPIYQATREHVLNPLGVNRSGEFVQTLSDRLSEFQNFRNGFVHHDLAGKEDLLHTWECFQDCLKGLLQAFYSGSK